MTSDQLKAAFSRPKYVDTRAGSKILRTLPLPPEHPVWDAYRENKEAVKAAHFSIGKAYVGEGWELNHWQTVSGQFEADVEILAALLIAAKEAEEQAREAMKIDYVAEDYEPLMSDAAAKLYDWQRPSCQRLVEALRKGNALDASQTGTGKTFIALAACAELDLAPFVIAPLAVLESWRRASQFMGVPLGDVTNYDKARAGSAPFIKKDKLAAKKKSERAFTFGTNGRTEWLLKTGKNPIVVCDEVQACFPFDSMIETEGGQIPIGEIVEKKLNVRVLAWNFEKEIVELVPILNHWQNSPNSVITIIHEYGELKCTRNHEIYSEKRGWIAAENLREDDMLYVRSGWPDEKGQPIGDMQSLVRSEIKGDRSEMEGSAKGKMDSRKAQVQRGKCSKNMGSPRLQAGTHQSDAEQQSNVGFGCRQEGDGTQKGEAVPDAGRKWEVDASAGSVIERIGTAHRAPRSAEKRKGAVPKNSYGLQDRCGVPCFEVGNRNRREGTQLTQGKSAGSEKGCGVVLSRVVRVEIQECGGGRGSSEVRGYGPLYDLEIEGHHNYFANGVLVHNCKEGQKTLQGRILIDLVRQGQKVLCLSATAAKDPTEMQGLGLALGLHQNDDSYRNWMKQNGCKTGAGGWYFTKNTKAAADIMQRLHRTIFPMKGTRIRSTDAPGYPENNIEAQLIDNGEIVKAYDAMQLRLKEIETKRKANEIDGRNAKASGLAAIMAARRASEFGKLDYMIEQTRELVADGFQVACFLNFREHLDIYRKALKLRNDPVWGTVWLRKEAYLDEYGNERWRDIDGPAQKPEQRTKIIDDFQNGKERVIAVSLMAGGAGISLHDVHGHAPRQSLISPSYSAIGLVQAIGRIWRAGSKSKATQRAIYASRTIEEEIAASITAKIRNIETLNDGDLTPTSIANFVCPDGLESI